MLNRKASLEKELASLNRILAPLAAGVDKDDASCQ